MQWSQALIFFGLLALYFSSIRSFHYNRLPPEWRNMIAFLNVFSVAAVQCSLASRFAYPQLSLEGQAFWMLGLAPTSTRRILLTKFCLAATAMVTVSLLLILLSTRMLRVAPQTRLVALAIMMAVSLAVAGLSTGLGAVFLDLKKSNPAAIVSGFGGTVNLVLSLLFMLAAILPFGAVFHLGFLGRLPPAAVPRALAWAFLWLAVITPVTAVVPLVIGRRAMQSRDY
jgi:ABC-2 type transport system permease protein